MNKKFVYQFTNFLFIHTNYIKLNMWMNKKFVCQFTNFLFIHTNYIKLNVRMNKKFVYQVGNNKKKVILWCTANQIPTNIKISSDGARAPKHVGAIVI